MKTYKIRPLQWSYNPRTLTDRAHTPFGDYYVAKAEDGTFTWELAGCDGSLVTSRGHAKAELAKAEAEEFYEGSLTSILEEVE